MATRKSTRAKKKQKRAPPVISADLKDQLDTVIAVIKTVQDAINDEDEQHLAMVLWEYALQPLMEVKSKLEAVRGARK